MFEIGDTLREARRARGLDISECEQHTKIRGKYLRALEHEEFDVLPSPTYVRGFLRTYARFLELDESLMLDEHHSRFGAVNPLTGELERAGRPPRRRRRRRRPQAAEARLLWLAIGGVFGLGLLIWMGVGGSADRTAVPASHAADTTVTGVSGPPAPEPDTAAAEQAPRRLTIVLIGEGEDGSYVEVRSHRGSGREVFRGTIAAGERRRFVVTRGIWVRSGNTDGLSAAVDGRRYELTGGVADYVLDAAGAQRTA